MPVILWCGILALLVIFLGWCVHKRRLRRRRKIKRTEPVVGAAYTAGFQTSDQSLVHHDVRSEQAPDVAKQILGNVHSVETSSVDEPVSDESDHSNVSDDAQADVLPPSENEQARAPSLKRSTQKAQVLTLYVMAPDEQILHGYELLQALLYTGLRYGEQQIFHRYQHSNNSGDVLFSVAGASKPGTFELSNMGAVSYPGLVLFMAEGVTAFDEVALEAMFSAAEQLADDLGAELWSAERRPLTVDDRLDYFSKLQPSHTADTSV